MYVCMYVCMYVRTHVIIFVTANNSILWGVSVQFSGMSSTNVDTANERAVANHVDAWVVRRSSCTAALARHPA